MNLLEAYQVNLNGYYMSDIMVCGLHEEFIDLEHQ